MKGYEKVKEVLESELDDYGFFKYGEIKINDAYKQTEKDEYYEVEVIKGQDEGKLKTLYFHYDREKEKLEIELGEDHFEEIETYDWHIKYFWMALLEW